MQAAKEVPKGRKVLCPLCREPLSLHGCYRRHYLDDAGKHHYGWVAQGHCSACNVYPSLLPHFLMPYKHYEAVVIEGVIFDAEENGKTSNCPADESTMRRWMNQFKVRGAQATGWLLSALLTIFERIVSAVELRNKSLLAQLARLVREYPVPQSDSIICMANIVLTMYNFGFI
jgi:hypothetical protein